MFSLKYNEHLDHVIRRRGEEVLDGKKRLHMSERTELFPREFFSTFISSLSQNDFIEYHWSDDLKEKLANRHGVRPENIFLGPGSEFVLGCIFSVFVSSSSSVWMPERHFPLYDVYLKQNKGLKLIFNYNENQELIFNSSAEYADLIIIGNPNSPVGDCVKLDFIKRLKGKCPLVIDQAYGEFGMTDIPYYWIDDGLIFVNTFSKALGAAGCRVGYAVASREIVNLLEKFKLGFELSNVSKKFAIHILDNYNVVQDYVNSIVDERNKLSNLSGVFCKFGNWIHVNQENFFCKIPKDWEVRNNIEIPHLNGLQARITIFPGLNEYLKD